MRIGFCCIKKCRGNFSLYLVIPATSGFEK